MNQLKKNKKTFLLTERISQHEIYTSTNNETFLYQIYIFSIVDLHNAPFPY